MQGHKYWQPFVDDSSGFLVVAFLSQKGQALGVFKYYKAYAEKALGKHILVSRVGTTMDASHPNEHPWIT
jgi:hypothetical protein